MKARSTPARRPGSEFDDFLFAPIGDDIHGMLISVVSLLARRNLDPWAEAASLAALPAGTATENLAALILALPDRPVTPPDSHSTAARLIALLPRRVAANNRRAEKSSGAAPSLRSKAIVGAVLFVVYMILLMGAQYFFSSDDAPTRGEPSHAPAAPSPK